MSNPVKAALLSVLLNTLAVPFVFAPALPAWANRAVNIFFGIGESILTSIFGGTLDIQPFGLLFDLFVNAVVIFGVLWGGLALWARRRHGSRV